MRKALAIIGVVGTTSVAVAAPAARSTPTNEASARRALMATRTECAKPGKRLAAFVAHYFEPSTFGRMVIAEWEQLTDTERGEFEQQADRVIGTVEREGTIRKVCNPKLRIGGTSSVDDTTVMIKVWAPDPFDSFWMYLAGPVWTCVGTEHYGVSNYHREWRRRLDPSRPDGQHADYQAAMHYLRVH